MSKKRPSLGGERTPSQRTDVTKMAASAIESLSQIDDFMAKDSREMIYISAKDIKKTFNARFIPCSLEEFAGINWPDLEIAVDEAKELYPGLLADKVFFTSLSEFEKDDFVNLLMGVHTTAQSIKNTTQVQPITLERDSADSDEAYLVDGERRTLSVLYSKGQIPLIRATVFNRRLTPLERAKIKDLANTSVSLNVHETILSKLEIYKAFPGSVNLSVRELGKLLGYKKTQAAIIKKLFDNPLREHLLKRVKLERLGWRQLKLLMEDPEVDFTAYEKETNATAIFWDDTNLGVAKPVDLQEVKQNKPAAKKIKDPNVRGLEERVSGLIGFPCKIDYSADAKKVRFSVVSTFDQFEDMLSTLKRIDVKKALEDFGKEKE